MKKQILALTFCLALAGCANNVQRQTTNVSEAEEELVMAAQSIENSLRLLAASEAQAPKPLIDIASLITDEGGLGGKATLDWSGPIEPLLQKVADLTDYRLRAIGQPPTIPVMVSITREEQILAEILKDAGLQAGNRASLVIYPSTRTIELRYLPIS